MKLEVNGNEYTNFLSVTATLRLDALSNFFEFNASVPADQILPFDTGDSCKVTVSGKLIITGFIEVVSVNYGATSHDVTLQGRDKTGDIVDSTIGKIAGVKAPISLKEIIEKYVKHIGVDIDVIDEVVPDLFNAAEDIIVPEIGESVFDFLEAMARKRQVLLTSDSAGNIVIAKSRGTPINKTLQNVPGFENNILRASYTKDNTKRFNKYEVYSSLNPVAANKSGKSSNSSVTNQSGVFSDSKIRSGRQLTLLAESPSSNDQCQSRAVWQSRIRKTRAQAYSVTVIGYRPNPNIDEIWELNTTLHVVDDFAGINAELLIDAITYTLDLQGGRTTTLSLVEPNAYTLDLTEPKSQKT